VETLGFLSSKRVENYMLSIVETVMRSETSIGELEVIQAAEELSA
jgi:hypothetical protein